MTGGELTVLLSKWSAGDKDALNQIFPRVYEDMRRLAARHLRTERHGHTLQTTALVNESYLRLLGREHLRIETRAQFFTVAAQTVRRVLVDHARKRRRTKRGGDAVTWVLDESINAAEGRGLDIIRLDDALDGLARLDSRQASIVEMKFFGGMEIEEIATHMGISHATVHRDWASARAFLLRELAPKSLTAPADSN